MTARVTRFVLCVLLAVIKTAGAWAQSTTPLIEAIYKSDVAAIEALIASGANVNQARSDGSSPLHLAVGTKNAAVVAALLARGANPYMLDNLSYCPVDRAASNGSRAALEAFLKAGVDPNWRNDRQGRRHLLGFAVQGANTETVELLLSRGADPNATYSKGQAALHDAAYRGHVAIIEMLVKARANVNALNSAGDTPLHFAAPGGKRDAVAALLAAGARVDLKNNGGLTPLASLTHVSNPTLRAEIASLMQASMVSTEGNSRAVLARLVADVGARGSNDQLRASLLDVARGVRPLPALPEEALNHEGRAQFAFKNAKSDADYLVAAKEYLKAIAAAPWVAGYYYDLCVILEKVERYREAKRACEIYRAGASTPAEATDVQRRLAGIGFALEQTERAFPECVAFDDLYVRGAKVASLGGRRISAKLATFQRAGQLHNALLLSDITDPNVPVAQIFPLEPYDSTIQLDDRNPGNAFHHLTIGVDDRITLRNAPSSEPAISTSVLELQKLRVEQLAQCSRVQRDNRLFVLLGQGGALQRVNGDYVAATLLFPADCRGKVLGDRPGWMPEHFYKTKDATGLPGVERATNPCNVGRFVDLEWLTWN